MSEWKKIRLGDISDMCLGKMLDKEKNKGELHPYLANINVRWGSFDLTNLNAMRFEESEHDRYGLQFGDIVICEGGEPGRCAIWREEIPDMKFQKALHRVRIRGNYSNQFVYYRFLLAGKNGELEKHFIGSTIKHLTGIALKDVEFVFPSFKDQQKIAAVLSTLDAKIELNQRINAELESMAKTLYDYWFVQFDFPNEKGKPYKSAGGKMVWNEELKREIPLGWEVGELGDFVDIFDSKRIPLSNMQREKMQGQYPYYGATSIMDYVNDYIFDGEYLLIAEDGSVMGDDGLAIVQYIWGKTWVNNHAHVLQPKNLSDKDYLYFLLKSISVIQIMTGSIQKKITQDNLLGVKFALPDKNTLKQFSEFARPIRQRIINLTEESQTLTELRDWLLPLLMNGQVKV
jgi:type I restriction enzyme S subunit